ncbi:hypothetical protein AMECASPLE_010550 [Ameca splendens]|uniref:Uncharacterized protein n=1 Tax=Ameca splendens TaxID=208324 RepID=A0ABV0XPU2_9TELE
MRGLHPHRSSPTIKTETCFCCSHHRSSLGAAVVSLYPRHFALSPHSQLKIYKMSPPSLSVQVPLLSPSLNAPTALIRRNIYNLIIVRSQEDSDVMFFGDIYSSLVPVRGSFVCLCCLL